MIKLFHQMLAGSVFLIVAGCGSFHTLPRSDADISSDLKRHKTYCSTVTRVYSGVGYDLCVLNAQPKIVGIDNVMLTFYAADLCASAVIDTVALPFTLVTQANYGSIDIPH